jgi:putative protease
MNDGAHTPTVGAPESRASGDAPAHYELQMAFSRGLYTGWFRGINNQELAHARFGTKRGVFLGTIERVHGESITLRLHAPLKAGDGLVFDAGKPEEREEGGRVYQIEPAAHGETTLRFGHGDIDWRRVRSGQRVWKTNDPALDRDLRTTFQGEQIRFRRPIRAEVHGRSGTPLTLILNDGAGHVVKLESTLPLALAEKQPLTPARLRDQLGRLGGTPFELGELASFLEGHVIVPVSELNRLRRAAVAALEELRAIPQRWTVSPVAERARVSPKSLAASATTAAPELVAVIRLPEQLEAAWSAGVRTLYCEFENPKHYRDTVARFRQLQRAASLSDAATATIWAAPPRIFKPGEEWILQQVRSCEADGYLVRNYDHLAFFADARKRGDFSLNVANPLTAEYFLQRYGLERVTASYDLNLTQLEALLAAAPGAWFDITLHQHMPMFHMEHCVFCAFLSRGKDYHDCGRPCEKHRVALRDRVGAELPLKADAGCRNTVYNNRAQTGAEYAARLLELGARSFRIEFVNESPAEVADTLRRYQQLVRGEITGAELWRELRLINQLGVTRGQMEAPPQVIARRT